MTIEVHGAFHVLESEWDALADRVEAPPWLRPGWFRAWWRAFGRGRLELVAARDGNGLAGVLPLSRSRGTLRALGNWHSPSFAPVADGEAPLAELAHSLARANAPRVVLPFLADGATVFRDSAVDAGRRVLARWTRRAPYVATEGPWEAYERTLDRKLRSEIRRRRRKLEEAGTVELVVHDGSARLDELLLDGLRVEAASWKGQRGTAILADPRLVAFYGDVARWAAERGWLRLAFLTLNGRPIAFDLGFEEAGSHHLVKTGYDPAYRRYGPGILLRHAMIGRAFTLGLRRYEFLGDADAWKLEWTDATRDHVDLQLFVRSPAGLARWVVQRYARPAAKRALAAVHR